MAHNLNENGKRMMYVGETPWHGLGTKLDNPATAVQAIEAAKLDYKVTLEPVMTKGGILIPDKLAALRQDTKCPLGVVGTGYRVVQNKEAFSFFDEVVGEGQAIYHTAGALGVGERIWILAKLPKELVVAREDIVEKYLILTNSHDGKSSLRMYFSPVRVVCQNTLTVSLMNAKDGISIRHTGDIKAKVDEARRVLGIAVKFYQQLDEIIKAFAAKSVSKQQVEKYFDKLLFKGDKDKEESSRLQNQKYDLLALFERGKGNDNKAVQHTVWTAYNAVTEYVDHNRTVKGLTGDPTNRLKSIWFGSGAELKNRAYEEALELVGIKK